MIEKITKRKARATPKKKRQKPFVAECKGKLCFAFDFGEYATKIAVARLSKGKIEIRDLVVVENDERTSKLDEASMKELRGRILRALSQHNLNPSGQIGLCTVGSRNYINRQMEIPYAEDADRDGIVAYNMSQALFLDMDSYMFQHKVLRTYEKDSVKMCTVWAAAVASSLCENYYRLLESLKLRPLIMDIDVNGVERLLNADARLHTQAQARTVAVIDYGMRGTEIEIFEKGLYREGFHIGLGDGQLTMAAKNVLGVQIADIHNGNKLIVPPQTVYNILRTPHMSETARGFRSAVEGWLTEVNTVIKRYNINHREHPVSSLLLYGGSLQFPWLKAYLEKYLGVPAEIISHSGCFSFPSKLQQPGTLVPQCLNALNLLLIR